MRQFTALLTILVLLAACGGAKKDSLEFKQEKLAELKEKSIALKDEIRALEKEITALDPSAANKKSGKLVTSMPVQPEDFRHYVEFQATAEAKQNVAVTTDLGGLVTAVFVEEGDRVSKGQVLAQLDKAVIEKNIAELQSALNLADVFYKKQERLWEQKIGSEVQYLQAKGERDNLSNKLQTAKAQLSKTRITSPINGLVDKVILKAGEMANPGRPAFRVVNVKDIEIVAEVSEAYINAISTSDEVLVEFPALETEIPGNIRSVGQVVDPGNRTFDLVIDVNNKDGLIKANLLANIRIKDFEAEQAVVIPSRLIQELRGEYFVYVIKEEGGEQLAEKRSIQTGLSYQGKTLVESGLTAGEILIDQGYRDVTNGEILQIVEEES